MESYDDEIDTTETEFDAMWAEATPADLEPVPQTLKVAFDSSWNLQLEDLHQQAEAPLDFGNVKVS